MSDAVRKSGKLRRWRWPAAALAAAGMLFVFCGEPIAHAVEGNARLAARLGSGSARGPGAAQLSGTGPSADLAEESGEEVQEGDFCRNVSAPDLTVALQRVIYIDTVFPENSLLGISRLKNQAHISFHNIDKESLLGILSSSKMDAIDDKAHNRKSEVYNINDEIISDINFLVYLISTDIHSLQRSFDILNVVLNQRRSVDYYNTLIHAQMLTRLKDEQKLAIRRVYLALERGGELGDVQARLNALYRESIAAQTEAMRNRDQEESVLLGALASETLGIRADLYLRLALGERGLERAMALDRSLLFAQEALVRLTRACHPLEFVRLRLLQALAHAERFRLAQTGEATSERWRPVPLTQEEEIARALRLAEEALAAADFHLSPLYWALARRAQAEIYRIRADARGEKQLGEREMAQAFEEQAQKVLGGLNPALVPSIYPVRQEE